MNTFCAPFSHEQAKRCCAHLLARYPFAAVSVLGRTAAGRAIFALHVGAPAGAPVLYVSGLSGRDAAGREALYRFFDCACRAVLRDTTLCGVKLRRTLQSRRLVVVPCLNPDGVEICRTGVFGAGVYAGLVGRAGAKDLSAWPCNARGVALAHNFDYRHAPHPFSASSPSEGHDKGTDSLPPRLTKRCIAVPAGAYRCRCLTFITQWFGGNEKKNYICRKESTN